VQLTHANEDDLLIECVQKMTQIVFVRTSSNLHPIW